MNERGRRLLPNRRLAVTLDLWHLTQGYHVTVGFFGEARSGRVPILADVAEVFVNSSGKRDTEVDINISDAAVAVSLALQFGCPLETLRAAMKRHPGGAPQGVVGAALDLIRDDLGDDPPSDNVEPIKPAPQPPLDGKTGTEVVSDNATN